MATYYKYAEREASNYINWAEIGKSLSDTLNAEAKRREDLKAELDKASYEFGEKLNNAPQGEYQPANSWVIDASSKIQEMRLIQDQLLKTGKWSLQQYLSARRNTEGDTKGMFDLVKEYQDEYKTKLEAYKAQKTSQATLDLMAATEGLANLQKSAIYINPTNGTANLGVKKLNPTTGVYEMTNDVASVQSLRNRIKMDIPKYDLGELKSDVGTLGETTIAKLKDVPSMNRVIAIESETDPTKRKALIDEESKKDPLLGTYLSWEENMVQSKLDNPFKVTSILTDFLRTKDGKNYKQTLNQTEFDNDKTGLVYLMKDDGSGILKPTFKPEQEQAVGKFIRDQYRNMITRTQKIDVATEPDVWHPDAGYLQWSQGNAEQKAKILNTMNVAGNLYHGTDQEVEAARTYFRDKIQGAKDVTRNPQGVTVTMMDGSSFDIPFFDANGQRIPEDRWLQSAVKLHGIEDVNNAIKQSGYNPRAEFNSTSTGSSTVRKVVDKTAEYNKTALTKDMSVKDLVVKNESGQTANSLQNAYGRLGFKFTSEDKGGAGQVNYVIIDYTDNNNDTKRIGEVEISGDDGAAQIDAMMRKAIREDVKAQQEAIKAKSNNPQNKKSNTPATPEAQSRIQGY